MQLHNLYFIAIFALANCMPAPAQAELGKWWKNSEMVRRLQLTEAQIKQIEETFLAHQYGLADANAKLKHQELQLKALMESDRVNDSQVLPQIDRVAAARATLEKTNAAMMLSIRKALSKDQWKKLQEMQTVPMSAATAGMRSGIAEKEDRLPDGVFMAGGPVQAPVITYQTLPKYTEAAREAKAEGVLLLEAIVRKNGSIDTFRILQGVGYGLDENAINTIKNQWKFKPGTLNDKPVDVKIVIETSFRLY